MIDIQRRGVVRVVRNTKYSKPEAMSSQNRTSVPFVAEMDVNITTALPEVQPKQSQTLGKQDTHFLEFRNCVIIISRR